jgi:hypothetical protein
MNALSNVAKDHIHRLGGDKLVREVEEMANDKQTLRRLIETYPEGALEDLIALVREEIAADWLDSRWAAMSVDEKQMIFDRS